MNLRTRFLLLISALIVVGSVSAWAVFHHLARQIVMQWGQRVADIQVRYDRARLLQPLEREIALARQMADSLVLKRWARSPVDPALEAEAVREMENFRRNFSSGNYFVALRTSGAYYHNNAGDEFAGRQLRYHLDPAKPADAWFYKLVQVGPTSTSTSIPMPNWASPSCGSTSSSATATRSSAWSAPASS